MFSSFPTFFVLMKGALNYYEFPYSVQVQRQQGLDYRSLHCDVIWTRFLQFSSLTYTLSFILDRRN